DGQANTGRLRDARSADAERQHVAIRGHHALAGDDAVDPVAVGTQGGDAHAEPDDDAELLLAHARQVLDEQSRVATGVADVANGTGDLPLDRLEDRIEPGGPSPVQDLLRLAAPGRELPLLRPPPPRPPVATEL